MRSSNSSNSSLERMAGVLVLKPFHDPRPVPHFAKRISTFYQSIVDRIHLTSFGVIAIRFQPGTCGLNGVGRFVRPYPWVVALGQLLNPVVDLITMNFGSPSISPTALKHLRLFR